MLNLINRFAKVASERSEVVAAVMVVMVVVMMIIPLNPHFLDALIAINITVSLLLVITAVLLNNPLAFSSFPAILLITTLLRLGLTISTTRLILLEAYAGDIVKTFGEFVVGGNVAVGLIIFLIISIVNFIVITKGSERVAEVAARFSLDGMPGKQMSIDSDLRAGLLSPEMAKNKRSLLEKETQLFGAMDGAIKFVKGDAIAGLIIAVVNIVGGISIGMLQMNMSFSEAGSVYAILSVGDGLVGQIPALMISIAAGLIVTRVTKGESADSSVARDMMSEILNNPKALLFSGMFSMGFAAVPGMPSSIFMFLSLGLLSMWYFKDHILLKLANEQTSSNSGVADVLESQQVVDIFKATVANALTVVMPTTLDANSRKWIENSCRHARNQLVEELGVLFPAIHFETKNIELVQLRVFDVPVYSTPIVNSDCYVFCNPSVLAELGVPYEKSSEPVSARPCSVVSAEHVNTLTAKQVNVVRPEQMLGHILQSIIIRKSKTFFTVQEYTAHIQQVASVIGEQVKELERVIPAIRVVEILNKLVGEKVSIRNIKVIINTLIDWAQKERDLVLIAEQVRLALRDQISYGNSQNGVIKGHLLSLEFEDFLRGAIRQTVGSTHLDVDIETESKLIESIQRQVEHNFDFDSKPVLVCSADCRRHLRQIIEEKMHWLPVMSYQEISNVVNFETLGEIQLDLEEN